MDKPVFQANWRCQDLKKKDMITMKIAILEKMANVILGMMPLNGRKRNLKNTMLSFIQNRTKMG